MKRSEITKDEQELKETLELLKDNPNEAVISYLSFGEYAVIPHDLLKEIINELNTLRFKDSDLKEGDKIELLTLKMDEDCEQGRTK